MAWRGSIPDNDDSDDNDDNDDNHDNHDNDDITFRAKSRLVETVFSFPTDKVIKASGHNGDHFYTHFPDKHKNHS